MGLTGVILAAAALMGGLPEDMFLGTSSMAGSARSAAMGQCSFMDASALGALANPALAAGSGPGISISASGGMILGVEKRTRTVYDSFGSSIGEAEDAFNRDADLYPGGLAISVSGIEGLPEGAAFAAGWRMPARFSYRYDRELRTEYYALLGEERLTIDGSLGEFCASAAFTPAGMFGFGLGAAWVSGTRETRWEQNWVDESGQDVLETTSSDLSGMTVRGSILLRPAPALTACLGAEHSMSLEWSGGVDGVLDLPPAVRAGISWLPGNPLRTLVVAEGYYRAMSGAEFAGGDMGLTDCWGASAGVENRMPGGPACRFGFRYDRSPLGRTLDSVAFTAGLGFRIEGWSLDVGGSFSPRSWEQTDVTGLPSFTPGDSLAVEETSTSIGISLARTLEL